MLNARQAQNALKKKARPEKIAVYRNFFKTGPGEYGEGDIFIGVNVPDTRRVAREFRDLPLSEIQKLLSSPVHEERLLALIILVGHYEKGDARVKAAVYRFYLKNARHVNNWDLVDQSAHLIVGAHLFNKDKSLLFDLVRSKDLWRRRIAIVATLYFIRKGRFAETLELSELLLNDTHDLIHKATGWMLREVGKRDLGALEAFLERNASRMPRTALRYAIERFPEAKRRRVMLK